jgi:large subunit ribosomal protein L29
MEVKEFRELSPEALDLMIYDHRANLFELRRKKAVGQLEHGEEIARVRKDIAKAETVKRERQLNLSK